MNTPEILIFDVNETLLDMSPLAARVNELLQNDSGFKIWFPTLLHHSLVETITNSYHDFSEIARATLAMTGEKMGVSLSAEQIKPVLALIKELPAHNDVPEGLSLLRKSGFRLVALTNGKPLVAMEQLDHAGLTKYFEDVYSVEAVKKYKPHHAPYDYVLGDKGVSANRAMMVAAHGWDIAGAQRAGLQTAFLQRPGSSMYPLTLPPTSTCKNCIDLARRLMN